MAKRKHDKSTAADRYGFMLEDIKRVAHDLGRSPTAAEYRELGAYPTSTLIHRFGSFNAAIKAAGLVPREKTVTDADIIADLRRVYERIGHPPTCAEYREHGKVSIQTIFRRFGNYLELLRKAGFRGEAKKRAETMRIVSEDEVFADYCRVAKMLGRPPSGQEYRKYGKHSYYRLRKTLGGLEAARERLARS